MEIISYIVDGNLTHQDSTGNKETLGRGCVQYMSAGTGIYHSEMNEDGSKPVRFIQIWIMPNVKNVKPNYGSRVYNEDSRRNQWLHVIAPWKEAEKNNQLIGFHQDANIYVTELEPGKSVQFPVKQDRQAYMLCIEGEASINQGKVTLQTRDALEIKGPIDLNVQASGNSKAHILVVEMPLEDDE
jgi:redox-sensitive bicupin YhaK (pirin superfamily)